MSKTALEQLYPSMNAEELDKLQSSNETTIEYEKLEGTPFTIAKKENKYHLLMGNWKMTDGGEESKSALIEWMQEHHWELIMKVALCICYDFMKPLATIQCLS